MAAATSTPHSVTPSTSSADGGGRITVLCALRRCLISTIDALSTAGLSPAVEEALQARCDELIRIEQEIVAVVPQNLHELWLQAEMVGEYAGQGDFSHDEIMLLVRNIGIMAGC